MAEGEDENARRHPLNMEGILRFCIENTKNEDVQNPEQFQEMSEELICEERLPELAEGYGFIAYQHHVLQKDGCDLFYRGSERRNSPGKDSTSSHQEEGTHKSEKKGTDAQLSQDPLINGSSSEPEETGDPGGMVKSTKGQRLLLKRCKAVEDLDAHDLAIIEEIIQSSSSSGDTQNDAASACSDSASQAESLPDIEAARRNQDHALATLGLYRYKIPGDGNCMFRAVASQLNLDQDKYHALLRQVAVKWMRQHLEELLGAGLLDGEEEIDEMVSEGSWPNQAALVALSNVLSMNIAVIQGGDKGSIDIQHITPITPPAEDEQTGIKLAYLYNGHYDSVVNEPNLSNPTYAMWAVQFMKDNTNLSRSSEDLLQADKSQEPYLPYVEYKSPWHRKEKVPEGDPRRSLSATPDPLDSDCSALSEAEENEMPTFDVENVTIPEVCTFVSELPQPSDDILTPVKSVATEEHVKENFIHYSPVMDSMPNAEDVSKQVNGDAKELDKAEKRRSAIFIVLGGSADDAQEDDSSVTTGTTLSKSRSLGDLATSVSLNSDLLCPMAENVKEEMIVAEPEAENSNEVCRVTPPRTISSPMILQAPVAAKRFPERRSNSETSFAIISGPEPETHSYDLGTYYPSRRIGEKPAERRNDSPLLMVNPNPIVPPFTPNVRSRILSHTVKLVPVKPSVSTSSPCSSPITVPQTNVQLNPLKASIKANGPVRITMPKEGFLRGVTDPGQIKVERKPFSVQVPNIQQMNYMWVTQPNENPVFHDCSPLTPKQQQPNKNVMGTYAHSFNPSVEQLWEKNQWSRGSPAGQSSCYSEPQGRVNAGESIHVEIPHLTQTREAQCTWLPPGSSTAVTTSHNYTHGLGYTNALAVNAASSFFPTQQVDFSRSTQTNLKLSSPVFPGQDCHARGTCGGVPFNLEKILSPLRRDVDAEYIANLLKQQWFK